MRKHGRIPYNPDIFDIFQLTNITTCTVYAIPIRTIENNIIISTFSSEILMKGTIKIITKILGTKI